LLAKVEQIAQLSLSFFFSFLLPNVKKKKNQLINFSKNDTKVNTILFAVFHSLFANDIK
jgi:hypothetical protein